MATDKSIISARAAFVTMSPRKLRLISDAVRHLPLNSAINHLKLMPHAAARPVLLVLKQAIGNAKNNASLSPDNLTISQLVIEEGPRFKRRDVHAHGARFDSGVRRKRMSHIKVTLTSREGK
jgi:large subunit ribosomal protein L22